MFQPIKGGWALCGKETAVRDVCDSLGLGGLKSGGVVGSFVGMGERVAL